MRPYIGITDFTSCEQVVRMLSVFRQYRRPGSKRMLHVGVMMSYKTLKGLETKWAKAFPPKEVIASIFSLPDRTGDLLRCLHYADYDQCTSIDDLARAIDYAGSRVNAVQLDMPWPSPHLVAGGCGIFRSDRQIRIILQIGARAIEETDNDPIEVVRRLESYEGMVQWVLLDKSMGRGLGMDADFLLPFTRAIRSRFPRLGLAVAGGLGPDSLSLVKPLVEEFPDVSIDAQGKLRPSGNALDPIDWDMAETYLARALQVLL